MSRSSKPYEALIKRLQQAKNRGRKQLSKVSESQSSSSISQTGLKDDWFDELLSPSSSQLWICGTCTFQNKIIYESCEMRGDDKDELKDLSKEESHLSIFNIIFEEIENIYSEIESLKGKEEKYEENKLVPKNISGVVDEIYNLLISINKEIDKDGKLKTYLKDINDQLNNLTSGDVWAFHYKLYHQTYVQNGIQGGIQGYFYFIDDKDIYELTYHQYWETKDPFLNPFTNLYHSNIRRIYTFTEVQRMEEIIVNYCNALNEIKELNFIRGSDGYPLQFDASSYIRDDKEKFKKLYTNMPGKELLPLPPFWLEVRDEKRDIRYINAKTFKASSVRPDK